MKPYQQGWALTVMLAVFFAGWMVFLHPEKPVMMTGQDVPDSMQFGNPGAAYAQAQELLVELQANNWNVRQLPSSEWRRLMFLPDQKYAEDPDMRSSNVTAFEFPTDPAQQELAFVCHIYVRQNRAYFHGDRSNANPTGKYLVGFKNGRVEWVDAVRARALRSGQDVVMAFPGMSAYRENLPLWHMFVTGN